MGRLEHGGVAWSQAAVSKSKATTVSVPLEDALVTIDRVFDIVLDLMNAVVPLKDDYHLQSSMALSNTIAGLAKRTALNDKHGVTPIPGMMYATWIQASLSSAEKPPLAQYLKAGEWTLVICHERPVKADGGAFILRYAFASMDEEGNGVTTDARGFLLRITGSHAAADVLISKWAAAMTVMQVSTTQEVREAMTLALGLT